MQVKGINVTSWADVTSAPPIDTSLTPFRPFSQCCGLRPGNNMIEFDKDCGWENFVTPNFTAMPDIPRNGSRNQSAAAEPKAETEQQQQQRTRKAIMGKRRLDSISVHLEAPLQ